MFEINDNQELRKKLIETGFQRIKDFSWEKMWAETLKIYKQVLSVTQ